MLGALFIQVDEPLQRLLGRRRGADRGSPGPVRVTAGGRPRGKVLRATYIAFGAAVLAAST